MARSHQHHDASKDETNTPQQLDERFESGDVVKALYKEMDKDAVSEGAAGGWFEVEAVTSTHVTFTTNDHVWKLYRGQLIAEVPGERRKRVQLKQNSFAALV